VCICWKKTGKMQEKLKKKTLVFDKKCWKNWIFIVFLCPAGKTGKGSFF